MVHNILATFVRKIVKKSFKIRPTWSHYSHTALDFFRAVNASQIVSPHLKANHAFKLLKDRLADNGYLPRLGLLTMLKSAYPLT